MKANNRQNLFHASNKIACVLAILIYSTSPAWAGTAIMANTDTVPGAAILQGVVVTPQATTPSPQAVQAPIEQAQPATIEPAVQPQIKLAPVQLPPSTKPFISIQPRSSSRPVPAPVQLQPHIATPTAAPPRPTIAQPVRPPQLAIPKPPRQIAPDLKASYNFARAAQQAAAEATSTRRQADISDLPQLLTVQKPAARHLETPTQAVTTGGAHIANLGSNTGLDGIDHGQDPVNRLLGSFNNPTGGGIGDGLYGEDNTGPPTIDTPGEAAASDKAQKILTNIMNGNLEEGGVMFNLYGPVRPDIATGNKASTGGWITYGNEFSRQAKKTKGTTSEMWGLLSRDADVHAMDSSYKGVKVSFDGDTMIVEFGKTTFYHNFDTGKTVSITLGKMKTTVIVKLKKTGSGGQTLDGSGGDVDDGHGSPIPMSVRRRIYDNSTAAASMPGKEPASDGGANPIDPIEQTAATADSPSSPSGGAKSQPQKETEQKNYAGTAPGSGLIGPVDPNLPGGKGGKASLKAPKGFHVIDPVATKTVSARIENNLGAESALDAHLGLLQGPTTSLQTKATHNTTE